MVDLNKILKAVRSNASSSSTGKCAHAVRVALLAGGYDINKLNTFGVNLGSAKNYSDLFKKLGHSPITGSDYKPGDIAVTQPVGTDIHGHISIFDGKNWISDFIQRDIYGGPKYRVPGVKIEVFRIFN